MRTSDELFALPFSGRALDRAGERRKDGPWLAAAAAAPSTRLLVLHDGITVPVDDKGELAWAKASATGTEPATWTFLGIDHEGAALFAITEDSPSEPQSSAVQYQPLREVGPSFDAEEAEAAIEAVALLTWHERHPFCARCGAATLPAEAGHIRHCPACGTDHFPRMDPAVIMLVSDGERCVLGRRAGNAEGRWSTLAGFVEPGESPEAAVAREVYEEVGLEVSSVHYRGSQPWPFPSSLMLAYDASATFGPLVANNEHTEVRWFTREEIASGMAGNTLTLPGPVSAGRALIRSWLG